MIVWGDEYSTGISYYIGHHSLSFIGSGTRKDDIGAVALGRSNLGGSTDGRHHNMSWNAMGTSSQCKSLSMVARTVCNDSFTQFFLGQTTQCVEGTSSLEGSNLLVVFAFEKEVDAWF
jgi:hypothetical protein